MVFSLSGYGAKLSSRNDQYSVDQYSVICTGWVISLQVTPACSEDTNATESVLSSQLCSTQLTLSDQDHYTSLATVLAALFTENLISKCME